MYKMVALPVLGNVCNSVSQHLFSSRVFLLQFLPKPLSVPLLLLRLGTKLLMTPGWAGAGVKQQTQSRWIALKRSLFIVFHWCWVRPSKCGPTAFMLVTNAAEAQGDTPTCKHCQIQRAVLTSTLQQFTSSLGCTVKGRDEAAKGKEMEYMTREILSWLWRTVMFYTECKYLKKQDISCVFYR